MPIGQLHYSKLIRRKMPPVGRHLYVVVKGPAIIAPGFHDQVGGPEFMAVMVLGLKVRYEEAKK